MTCVEEDGGGAFGWEKWRFEAQEHGTDSL